MNLSKLPFLFKSTFIVFSVLIALSLTHYNIVNVHIEDAQKNATDRINLYQESLLNELMRFNFLPFVLAQNEQLINNSFQNPNKTNIALENIKQASGANEVYIMNDNGTTLSASNWRSESSFVNKNFSFRPYFKEAMAGKNGQFFGIGTTSKKPGFYISTGVNRHGKIIAVTVAKVDLSVLENIWTKAGENIFVTNKDGVVILSSQKKWKYQVLGALKQSQLASIKQQKQFSGKTLAPLTDDTNKNNKELIIKNQRYLYKDAKIKNTNWHMHYLTSMRVINQRTYMTWTKIGLVVLILLSVTLLLWSLRSHDKLKSSRQESHDLKTLNKLLEVEIINRKKTENELIIARKSVERASKLAAMGQLSTSIIHELGQPLAAMKAYIASAKLPPRKGSSRLESEKIILPKLDALVERMSQISKQLKFFSTEHKNKHTKIEVRDALKGALLVVSPALAQDNVELTQQMKNEPCVVKADQIHLEQVFINLINNARIAVKDTKVKKILIQIATNEDKQQLIIKVADTGVGISEDVLHMLFNPFYTNSPSKVGLGLGLTISANIIHQLGGTLIAENNSDKGATFIINIPL